MGLDLSLTGTAIVVWDGDKVVWWCRPATEGLGSTLRTQVSGLLPSGRFRGNDDERVEFIVKQVRGAFRKFQPDLVYIEGLSYQFLKGAAIRIELLGVIKNFLHRHEAPYDLIAPKSLKKKFTGRGDASKQEMIAEAKRYWPDMLPIDDLADALALAKVSHDEYDLIVVDVEDEED